MNIGSIKHKKLWGARDLFAENFDLDYGAGDLKPSNLGIQIPLSAAITTHMLSAGVPIVARQMFNNEFRLITPMVIDNSHTFGSGLFQTSAYPLSTYPLSAYSNRWGWNIDPDAVDQSVSGIEIVNYYDFYNYVQGYDGTQLEGVIDWNNPGSNVTETLSSLSAWSGQHGMLENMIDHSLRMGTQSFADAKLGGDIPTSIDVSRLAEPTQTFTVTIPDNTNVFMINGRKRPTLYLQKGNMYQFVTDVTTTFEPFRFFSEPDDTSKEVTDGVTLTSDAAGVNGIFTIVPTPQTPDILYYGSLSGTNYGFAVVFL